MNSYNTNEPRRSNRRKIPGNDEKHEVPAQKKGRKADKAAGNDDKSVKKSSKIVVKHSPNDGKKVAAKNLSETTKTEADIEAAKRTLVGLPEDLHRLIIPRLGLVDRGNLAATCKELYQIEAKVDNSFEKVEADNLLIYPTEVSFTRKYKLPHEGENDLWRIKTTSLSLTADKMEPVLRRLVRTTKCVSFSAKLDLNESSHLSILAFIPASAAYRIDIFHLPNTRAVINFIEVIPWNLPIGDFEDTYINIYCIQVLPNKIPQLYECAKNSTFQSHRFHLRDATAFSKRVMGFQNFTFDKFKKNTTQRNTARMTTSIEDVEVYYTEHNPIRFFMKDGQCETRVKRVYGELLEVEMKKGQAYYHRLPQFKRIPYLAK